MADDIPEPTVKAVRYEVSCLPEDDDFAGSFSVTVEYRGNDLWAVLSRTKHLGTDGNWSWGYLWEDGREPVTEEEVDSYNSGYSLWLAAHRFDEENALRLAQEQAPLIRVNRLTVADALKEVADQ